MVNDSSQVFTWKIGGTAGGGQQVAGLIFTKACIRGGLYTFDSSEYPSLIRGGIVTYRVSIGEQPIFSIYKKNQLLVALTKEAFDYCLPDMTDDGVILYDSDKFKILPKDAKNRKIYPLPLKELVAQAKILPIASNIITIGTCTALLDYDLNTLNQVITDVFSKKGKKVVAMNIEAAKFGYQYAMDNLQPDEFPYSLKAKPANKVKQDTVLVTANDTISLGAVAAGCKFSVAYPMTPSSSILHNLANWAEETGMIVKHPEDEIAGINMAIGAAYAGVRSMTSTSGGGFALMNEGLSLAGITETPLVIIESQRPGPATGVPTWTEQGDLAYVAHAGHGEFIRVVLAPGDATEAFYLTTLAFNLAEKWQIPVFIMVDKYISEGRQTTEALDITKFEIERGEMVTEQELAKISQYKRYKATKSGVSPRSIPGQKGGTHVANSDDHDEFGFSIEGFTPEIRNLMVEKRAAKLDGILKELPQPQLFGPKVAKLTLIGWGSVKSPVLEALKNLKDVNYIHISAPWPLSETKIRNQLKNVKKLICIENNQTGQFANILRETTGITVDGKLNKYDGAQFFPEEVIENINKLK